MGLPPNPHKKGGPPAGSRVVKKDGVQPDEEFVGRSVRPETSKDSVASKAEVEDVTAQVRKAYGLLIGLD